MNKFGQISTEEFTQYINKKISLDFYDIDDSLKSMKGIIQNYTVGKANIHIQNQMIEETVPFMCKFLNVDNNITYNIRIKYITKIEVLE